jgi:hypothetical protein
VNSYHIQNILPRPFSPEYGGRNSSPSFAEFLNINKIEGEYKFTLTVAEITVSASSIVFNVVFSMTGHSQQNRKHPHQPEPHCIMMKVPYTTARFERVFLWYLYVKTMGNNISRSTIRIL